MNDVTWTRLCFDQVVVWRMKILYRGNYVYINVGTLRHKIIAFWIHTVWHTCHNCYKCSLLHMPFYSTAIIMDPLFEHSYTYSITLLLTFCGKIPNFRMRSYKHVNKELLVSRENGSIRGLGTPKFKFSNPDDTDNSVMMWDIPRW